jgi:hypothetical protein
LHKRVEEIEARRLVVAALLGWLETLGRWRGCSDSARWCSQRKKKRKGKVAAGKWKIWARVFP